MAHQADNSVIETVVQLLSENELSHMADAMRLLLNEARAEGSVRRWNMGCAANER